MLQLHLAIDYVMYPDGVGGKNSAGPWRKGTTILSRNCCARFRSTRLFASPCDFRV